MNTQSSQLWYIRGFTLIELLVVIAIIGLLASVVLASTSSARQAAVEARIDVEFKELSRAVFVAQMTANAPLMTITGNNCSDCVCRTGISLRAIPDSDACVVLWVAALTDIAAATGGTFPDLLRFTRDPWGAPYLLDENENEVPADVCRDDTLRSAGPNSILGDSDDLLLNLPFHSPSCT
jgi:prepilin-type N-terminal cleavage/methylation domain-containing protein